MLRKRFISAAIALSSMAFLAGTALADGNSETLTIVGPQGSPITITVPTQANEVQAPYALTGQENQAVPMSYQTFGNMSVPMWLPE